MRALSAFLEDPKNDGAFRFDNGHGPAGLGGVAVEPRARGETLLGVGVHPAFGLGREAFQVVLADEALEGDAHRFDPLDFQGG
ncbi:MAG: hypothetical protein Q8Q77_05625 [Phenylobacterium sp.]|nr:hypothetical protein [Phenylobacterium sp.]MDP3853182.1 hypothetical protein [Phenylobacterium sp.]